MKYVSYFSLLVFSLSLGLTAPAYSSSGPDRVVDFALLDHNGAFHQLSRMRNKKAIVIFSQSNSCPAADATIKELRKIRDQWQDKDVAFLMMNSTPGEDLDSVRQYAKKNNIDFPIMLDTSQLAAEDVKLTKAGEVVVLTPGYLQVAYRGPVHEHIGMMLKQALAGKLEQTMEMPTEGCDIAFPARDEQASNVPDYATDIAPLLKENCAYCHREGGIGPFAMNSYNMIRGWSHMMREVLLTKRMPPMQVDPNIGHFSNANYISDKDLQTLVHWISAGAPRGNSEKDPLTDVKFVDRREWQLGEPDYIVKAPVHDVPATGVVDYINDTVELTFDEDKWVKAVQFIPGDPAVLHHLLTYVVPPKQSFVPGQEVQQEVGEAAEVAAVRRAQRNSNGPSVTGGRPDRHFLEGYAPGKVDAMTFPKDTGVFIPKGYRLAMQFHYTTNGKASTDATLLGLYFYDKPPKHQYLNRSVATMFKIPPYAIEHKVAAQYVFDKPVVVYGLRAHMHFRGKYMKFSAELPDGTTKELLSVPNYNYGWQPTYQLEKPAYLPAGTKVHVTGAFDNSEFNPANPDPSKELTFGLQSWDEMFIGYWSYYEVDDADKMSEAELNNSQASR